MKRTTMKLHLGILFTMAMLLSTNANAAERVLSIYGQEVTISNNGRETWSENDSVCLYQARKAVACGDVERSNGQDIRIRAENAPRVAVGERVFIRPNVRHPSSSSVDEVLEGSDTRKYVDFAVGVAVGPNYFYPEAHIQFALGQAFSIGVMPMFVNYFKDATSVKTFGGFVTLNYYYTHSTFRGLYFQAGGGFYSIRNTVGTVETTSSPTAALGTVNWRGKALGGFLGGVDIGVGAGAQYVFNSSVTTGPTYKFSGFLPLVKAFIGYSF